jgi:hypothetical protein
MAMGRGDTILAVQTVASVTLVMSLSNDNRAASGTRQSTADTEVELIWREKRI